MEKYRAMEIFKEEFDTYESRSGLEDWTGDVLATLPDYFWEKPASSTGKHHSLVQNGPHGNVIHTKMNVRVANDLFRIRRWGGNFDPLKRDMVRTALILHDGLKYGDDTTGFAVHEHPLLMAEYIMGSRWEGTLPESVRRGIAGMVAAHSGQWTTSRHSSTVLPAPSSEEEFFVHLCDYIGSREDILVQVGDTDKLFGTVPSPQGGVPAACPCPRDGEGDKGFDERVALARMMVQGNRWNGKVYGNREERFIYLNGSRVSLDERFLPAFQVLSLTKR